MAPAPVNEPGSCQAVQEIAVPLGQRVMVVGDLLLPTEPTATSAALAADVAQTLLRWQGPGVVVVCGDLFAPLSGGPSPAARASATLEAHAPLSEAMRSFAGTQGRRLVVLPGWRDPEVADDPAVTDALRALGAEVARAVDLRLTTASGERRVMVRAGTPVADPAATGGAVLSRPWLSGIERLEDPTASSRFVTSRVLYRRLGRLFAWVALLPLAVALLLRLPIVFEGLRRLFGSSPRTRRAITHAYSAGWSSRLLFTVVATTVVLLVLAAVLAAASRVAWTALGGSALPRPWRRRGDETGSLDTAVPDHGLLVGANEALDEGRALVAARATGLIAGGGLRAEMIHLDPGFYASPGGTTELVREHPGRLGLPPVFLHHRQASWVELETGAELHVRLMLADVDAPSSTLLERLVTPDHVVKGYKAAADLHPTQVASWPSGSSWPPPPGEAAGRQPQRRVRRIAAAAIFLAGLLNLLEAVTPPLRSHLHLVQQLLPVGVIQAAGALVAFAGVALMMLARGVLRGQRRSWLAAVGVLAATVALHLVHAASIGGIGVAAAVLAFMVVERRHFAGATDAGSVRSAVLTLVAGGAAAIAAATAAVVLSGAVGHRTVPAWWVVAAGAAERLIGLRAIGLPDPDNDWVSPSLLAVGIALAVVVLYLLTRPVVDRGLSSSTPESPARRAAEHRARDIVRRHGSGTLDYFALRDDKQWFFHRDSLVAYGVYGGVCLVSPDPIGPRSEQAHVWTAFRHYADRNGWAVGVMGAAEEWLPTYRDSGMRHIYIGDEAVVDVAGFSLQGGKMKGLRQAVNRVERYGYRAEVMDPAHPDPATVASVTELMGKNRRGEFERGFSMTLGRVFDPRDAGLLMTVVRNPAGDAVAMCQFVPSPAVDGYSLDLMRRDPGEHPNGLLDFALVTTLDHLRRQGSRGLSLNFAAMRSALEGENGDGITQRVERWALRRLSGVLQIETLWRFNAKYGPAWLPRYIVWDSAEQFVPTAVQILRAESLTEIPVVGRLMAAGQSRKAGHGAHSG